MFCCAVMELLAVTAGWKTTLMLRARRAFMFDRGSSPVRYQFCGEETNGCSYERTVNR